MIALDCCDHLGNGLNIQPLSSMFKTSPYSFLLAVLLTALPFLVGAETPALCPPAMTFTPRVNLDELPSDALVGDALTLVRTEDGLELTGDVVLEDRTQRLRADKVTHWYDTGAFNLTGNVLYDSSELRIKADAATYDQTEKIGNFNGASYWLHNAMARGTAESIDSPAPHLTVLNQATYTTCEGDPPAWSLSAKRLTLNQETGVGSAHHLRLHWLRVPVFYWPYINFPLDDRRKSGLLFPTLGNSSDNGFEYRQPIYWNIHPQADATITPRHLKKRGLQMQSEWRYLNRFGHFQLDAAYLEDRLYTDEHGDEQTRWLLGFSQSGSLGKNWYSYVKARKVSDIDYLNHLGSEFEVDDDIDHLQSGAGLIYSGPVWRHHIGVERFQTLDPDIAVVDQPYRRLPFMTSEASVLYRQLDLGLNLEWVQFDHTADVNGQRFELYPHVSKTFGTLGWYITPKSGLRYTAYQLDDLKTTTDASIHRAVPIVSIDSGLFFERKLGQNHLQTLEPRLYGLYVPVRDQDQIPLFDTGSYAFSYAQLFRENRFSGLDRQADARQLSLGLTTRVLRQRDNSERLRASVGRIHYLGDREVSLQTTPDENEQIELTRSQSDWIGDLSLGLWKHGSLDLGWQYDSVFERTERKTVRLQYHASSQNILNLGYRSIYAEVDPITQTEISTIWSFNSRWTLFAYWLYDTDQRQSYDTFVGVEYRRCCWAFSLVGRRRLQEGGLNEEDQFDREILFQLSLTGLANLGSENKSLLERHILGYVEDQRE